jgi:ribosomal protein S27AE
MANLAEDWTIGWLKCGKCGYEWNAAVDLPVYGKQVVEIVTEVKEFKCSCPKCGQESCKLWEIMG